MSKKFPTKVTAEGVLDVLDRLDSDDRWVKAYAIRDLVSMHMLAKKALKGMLQNIARMRKRESKNKKLGINNES